MLLVFSGSAGTQDSAQTTHKSHALREIDSRHDPSPIPIPILAPRHRYPVTAFAEVSPHSCNLGSL